MRLLVTGGAGAIGSHLVDVLLERGCEVAVLDSFDDFYPRAHKQRNLAAARAHTSFADVYEGDIRDRDFVSRCFDEFRPAGVFHLAARAGVRPSMEAPVEYCDVNLRGTAVVVTEAVRSGCGRLVFASSSTVYGESERGAFVEEADTDRPLSPYGATKRGGELFCYAIHRASGMPITCLRLFSVYGPRQRPDLALAHFAQCMLRGKPIPVFGDGSVERDFTYITDILDGMLRAFDRAAGFEIYNLGCGRPVVLNDAIAMLERALDVRAERDCFPSHPADMPRTWASIEKAKRELGYAPQVQLEEGIAAYVRWLREIESCGPS